MLMLLVREYVDKRGRSPFGVWFNELNGVSAVKVRVAVSRLAQGNLSNVKSVGSGVLEYRIDFGPGYRICFGRDGEELVVLLAGGTKKRQQQDIVAATGYWQDYKRRKRVDRDAVNA